MGVLCTLWSKPYETQVGLLPCKHGVHQVVIILGPSYFPFVNVVNCQIARITGLLLFLAANKLFVCCLIDGNFMAKAAIPHIFP